MGIPSAFSGVCGAFILVIRALLAEPALTEDGRMYARGKKGTRCSFACLDSPRSAQRQGACGSGRGSRGSPLRIWSAAVWEPVIRSSP